MDLAAEIAQYRATHEAEKRQLQDHVTALTQQVDDATNSRVSKDPHAKRLEEQRSRLAKECEDRKKQLHDECIAQQQKLDKQFALNCIPINQELFRIGNNIAAGDPIISAVARERNRMKDDLRNHGNKSLYHVFNMLPSTTAPTPDAAPLDPSLLSDKTTTTDTVNAAPRNVSHLAESNGSTLMPEQRQSKRETAEASAVPTHSKLQNLSQRSKSNTPVPSLKNLGASGAQASPRAHHTVHTGLVQPTNANQPAQSIFAQFSKTKTITPDQFVAICKVYSHAYLKDGVVYLRSCKACGYNAKRDVKPTDRLPHFIQGDMGFVSHVSTAHKVKTVTVDSINDFCDLEVVDHDDAVLISQGKTPKLPMFIRNVSVDMPYEDFKRKAHQLQPQWPRSSNTNADLPKDQDDSTPMSQKQTPSDFFTMGRLLIKSGDKTTFKREPDQAAEAGRKQEAVTAHPDAAKKEVRISPISIYDSDEEDDMPISKRRRTLGKSR